MNALHESAQTRTDPELGSIATRLLIESEKANVWDLVLQPGEATAWHKHDCDYIFVVINNGDVYTEYLDGTKEHQNNEVGSAHLIKADAVHRLVNRGSAVYRDVVIELKAT